MDKIEKLLPESAPLLACPRHRPIDIAPILRRYPMRGHIAAIDRETGDHRPQRPAQPVPRIIAAAPVPLRDAMKIAREHGIHHEMLGIAQQLVEIGFPPDETLIIARRRGLLPRIDQKAVELADEIVTGGSRHRPIRAQPLVPCQNLLENDITRCALPRSRSDQRLQPGTVLAGIEQPINMIDAQSVQLALAYETRHETMDRGKKFRILDADASKIVDVEK